MKTKELDLSPLTRFLKTEYDFKLTKTASKRDSSVVVGQFEVGRFGLVYIFADKYGPEGVAVSVRGRGVCGYLRTSPVVKIIDYDESTVQFETEGGEYRLERI